jgi:tol-pal system protein YbgF
MSVRARRLLVVPVLTLATGACFATRSDVRVLQGDIAVLRAEAARADSLHREQLRAVSKQVGAEADSLKTVQAAIARLAGDVNFSFQSLGQQMISMQELVGQSQKRLGEFKAEIEARAAEVAQQQAAAAAAAAQPPAAGAAPTTAPVAPSAGQPGPNQLYQAGQAQLNRSRYEAARAAFQDFLAAYPTHELAPDAQYGIAETWAQEGKSAAADSAYQAVVDKYPKSEKAPTALYKRATTLRVARQLERAKALYQQVIDKYPRSPEAELAAEFLKTLK